MQPGQGITIALVTHVIMTPGRSHQHLLAASCRIGSDLACHKRFSTVLAFLKERLLIVVLQPPKIQWWKDIENIKCLSWTPCNLGENTENENMLKHLILIHFNPFSSLTMVNNSFLFCCVSENMGSATFLPVRFEVVPFALPAAAPTVGTLSGGEPWPIWWLLFWKLPEKVTTVDGSEIRLTNP